MEMYHFIYLSVGLFIGGGMAWVVAKSNVQKVVTPAVMKAKELEIQLKMEIEKSMRLGGDIKSINDELRSEREKSMLLSNQYASLVSDHKNLNEVLKTQKGELENIREKSYAEFKNLAKNI